MSDEKWLEASSRITNAVEYALSIDIDPDEIRDLVEDAFPTDTPHVGGGPKRPKKEN